MTGLSRVAREIALFFAQHNIPTDSLTVIVNIADRHAAACFDAAVMRDADQMALTELRREPDIRRMQINGVKIRVESPLHTP